MARSHIALRNVGLEAGPVAARALASCATGSVAAAFESSFYVDLAGVLVCVGARRFPMGPLNVRTSACDSAVASAIPGTPVTVYDGRLEIEEQEPGRRICAAPRRVPDATGAAQHTQPLRTDRT